MGRSYTVGDTPGKSWRQVPWRGAWSMLAVLAGIAASIAFWDVFTGAHAENDSPIAILPLATAVLFSVVTAHAAYRARMRGRFADENPELFVAAPAPDREATRANADPFAAYPQTPSAQPRLRLFCPYCGESTAPDHRFCAFCGKGLPRDDEPPPPAEPQDQTYSEES